MAIRDAAPAASLLLAAALGGGCSFANMTYAEVERDLDAIVRVEGQGDDLSLSYQSNALVTAWYLQWSLLWPLRPLFDVLASGTVQKQLENPSDYVRRLVAVLAPKAGADLRRSAGSVRRLVLLAHLDTSALNRIYALNGLWTLAVAHDLDLIGGLELGPARLEPAPELAEWLADFGALRPAQRTPVGASLPADQAARYRSVLAGMCARPLPQWNRRLALVADLANALGDERDPALRAATADALRAAMRHAIQWTMVLALLGRESQWTDVRLRALELLHRAGGAESVPLLLALLVASPERIAKGDPPFETTPAMRLRLIHLCGQLDRERALRAVVLPGRESWQETSPAEFLARIALEQDPLSPSTSLVAREAMGRCLGRERLDLDGSPTDGADWIEQWYTEHTRQRVRQ